jgi:L-alanine-DL-glutamate epimerase-like enolase superfamily enzyme
VYPSPKAHKVDTGGPHPYSGDPEGGGVPAQAEVVDTGGPHPYSGDPPDIERLVAMVQQARQRVGPDGSVMFDAHCAIPPALLIQLAAAIQPFDILFLEEVAVPGNIEVFKRLKEQIRIPLATGERPDDVGHDPLFAGTVYRHPPSLASCSQCVRTALDAK